MERKYIIYTASGIKVDVVEAKSDTTHDIELAVLGEKEFSKHPFSWYTDAELIAQGFEEIAKVSGSLFFNEGTSSYANGIEKAYGVVHENDDAAWDNNGAFYIKNGIPYIYTQAYVKKVINDPSIRGAITAAFTLVNNGNIDISEAKVGQPSRQIYLQKSGRTIVGKRADNTIVLATFDGVTGSSGLTGYETAIFARDVLKLRNAVCMDGGGSTFLSYKGTVYNGSSREGVNAIAIYARRKTSEQSWIGTKVRLDTFTITDYFQGKVFLKELNIWVDETAVTKV